MQAWMETIFDICYLGGVLIAGLIMYQRGAANPLVKKFGAMAVFLALGDAFHLVPRMYALWTTGLEANAAALGIGKLITSITMTLFYLILYDIWVERYGMQEKRKLTMLMGGLAAVRILLCLLPQNQWLSYRQPLFWGILRNIPFAVMGVIIIVLFYREASRARDRALGFMALAVALSFGFYVPVVLFSATFPLIGMLMIPKTLAYIWVVYMGWNIYRTERVS